MNTYLLFFDNADSANFDRKAFVDSLDQGAKMLTFDSNICFLKTGFSVREISDRVEKALDSRLYFISDISNSEFSGRMPGVFWKEFNLSRIEAAAE